MTEEIKDCPFCGKQPVIEQTGKMQLKLYCQSCIIGIEQKAIRYDLDWLRGKIIERWNKRVASEQITAAEARIKELEGLLERASWLVGNPGTNISSSTDLACESWQEDYKKLLTK